MKDCYEILSDVREALNEHSPAYVQGQDTSGTYKNSYLIRKINEAQSKVYNLLIKRKYLSEQFLTQTTLTGVNSVYTLPADFGKIILFRDAEGLKIHPINQEERRLTDGNGSKYEYYRSGNTLVIDTPGLTSTCTLIYYKKPRDITMGLCTAGGALSITLAKTASIIADYYNGMQIKNITSDWYDTISDYSSARVATIGTNTAVAGDYYGIVPDMPEPFHEYISRFAVIKVKAEFPVSQEKPSNFDVQELMNDFNEALSAYAGEEDFPVEQFFMDDQDL